MNCWPVSANVYRTANHRNLVCTRPGKWGNYFNIPDVYLLVMRSLGICGNRKAYVGADAGLAPG